MSRSTAAAFPRPDWPVEQEANARKREGGPTAKLALLTDGVSQSLTLFGRNFHVQTEICDGRLRTEIFLGGRMIATRETQLDSAERQSGVDTQRLRMLEFHQRIVSGVLERASRYRENQHGSAVVEASSTDPARTDSAPGVDHQSSPKTGRGTDESTDLGLRVRQLINEFRNRVSAADGNAEERLAKTSAAFAWVRSSPLFGQIRIDEQLRFHLLQDQIDTWLSNGDDPRRAVELWRDLSNFASYLAGIEQRAEFIGSDLDSFTESTSSSVESENVAAKSSRKGEFRALPSPLSGSPQSRNAGSPRENSMAQVSLEQLAAVDGFVGACLVDSDSGMMLGAHGGGSVNLELAAAGNTQVVRAKRKTMESLKLKDRIEDILISLEQQYHLIRMLDSNPKIFLYLVLDRGRSNLAMARHELRAFEGNLNIG